MNTAELLVRCLENEGVKVVFGIPGKAFRQDVPALIECPVDYAENEKLTRHLKKVYAGTAE